MHILLINFLFCLDFGTGVLGKWCKENQDYICCSNYFLNLTTNQCQICPDGSFDVNCSKTCYPGLYGKICLHQCPLECNNTCHHVTGDCPGASLETSTSLHQQNMTTENMIKADEETESSLSGLNLSSSDNFTRSADVENSRKQMSKLNTIIFIMVGGGLVVIVLLIILTVNVVIFCKQHTKSNYKDGRTEQKPVEPHYQTIEESNMVLGVSVLTSEDN